MFSLSQHGQIILIFFSFLLWKHSNRAIIINLLKSLDEIVELRWKNELIRFIFLAKQEQQHKSLQFLSILLSHISHYRQKSFVLSCDSFILINKYLHHSLQLLMLISQHLYFLLQLFLTIRYGYYLLIFRLFVVVFSFNTG